MLKSLSRLLHWTHPRFAESAPVLDESAVEEVRDAMRAVVQDVMCPANVRLMGAIERATDLRALWFLRGRLMEAVATAHGEACARQALCRIDGLLRAGWPEAPVSRLMALG